MNAREKLKKISLESNCKNPECKHNKEWLIQRVRKMDFELNETLKQISVINHKTVLISAGIESVLKS